jgi:hypothetical protein
VPTQLLAHTFPLDVILQLAAKKQISEAPKKKLKKARHTREILKTSRILHPSKISFCEYINLKRGSNISSRTSTLVTCTRNGNFSVTAHSPYTSKSGEEIERERMLNLNRLLFA